MFVLTPELSEGELDKAIGALKEAITKNNGNFERVENIGKKALAYRIKKKSEGIYLLLYFRINPLSVTKLENAYRLNESVLRVLIIKRGV